MSNRIPLLPWYTGDREPGLARRLNAQWSQLMDPTRFGMPVRDPGLAKLMDSLPKGDPDAEPPNEVEVSLVWCEQTHRVRAGEQCTLKFGPWGGPPMPLSEVYLWVRNLKTGVRKPVKCLPGTHHHVEYGNCLTVASGPKGFTA
jgi:hypothetical protein